MRRTRSKHWAKSGSPSFWCGPAAQSRFDLKPGIAAQSGAASALQVINPQKKAAPYAHRTALPVRGGRRIRQLHLARSASLMHKKNSVDCRSMPMSLRGWRKALHPTHETCWSLARCSSAPRPGNPFNWTSPIAELLG